MLSKDVLKEIVASQKGELESADIGVEREILKNVDLRIPHAAILSGVRRCGKSTLLKQIIRSVKTFCYFNFEDQRALDFEISDFEKLNEIFKEKYGDCDFYFFDEVQNVQGWERFVRRMQDSGKKFVITGSNASLLSRELGTRLTGRHISYELFPFSYSEMLKLTMKRPSRESLEFYIKNGGFPEFLKYGKIEVLQELLSNIIARDIVTRYGLKNAKMIKEIAIYLLTNVGKEFSLTKLTKHFSLGSVNTLKSYVSYFEDSYLLFTIPKFDYSYKKQVVNPKKAYSIDTGLSNANSASFSEDKGRALENTVFLGLRKKYKDVFYFRERGECDFLTRERGEITQAIQVCLELNEDNKQREISGLEEAMQKFGLKKGLIVTLDQEDRLGKIEIKPAWKWLLEH